MIAPWLFYAVSLAALFGCAALVVDSIGQWRRWSLRWIWFGALIASVAAPIVGNFFATPKVSSGRVFASAGTAPSQFPVDTVLLVIWASASLLLIARLVTTLLLLQRTRRNWFETTIDGTPVLLTRDVGPALIGFTHPRPVVPTWAFNLETRERTMILRHEAEHARAGDPLLLAIATISVAAMPWNPALWWLSRRLRLAVEMDCDARVLRSGVDPHAYATLLVAVGERISRAPFAWATALATPPSFLQRRIRAMMVPSLPRKPMLAIGGLSLVAVAAVVVACSTPLPDQILPVADEQREELALQFALAQLDSLFARIPHDSMLLDLAFSMRSAATAADSMTTVADSILEVATHEYEKYVRRIGSEPQHVPLRTEVKKGSKVPAEVAELEMRLDSYRDPNSSNLSRLLGPVEVPKTKRP